MLASGFDKSSKGPLGTTISTYLKTLTEEKKKKKGGRLRGQKVLKYIIGKAVPTGKKCREAFIVKMSQ